MESTSKPRQQIVLPGQGKNYDWANDHVFVKSTLNLSDGRVTLVEDRLKLTAGIKFLDNTYSHGNFLPNARLLWTPDTKQSFWASATR